MIGGGQFSYDEQLGDYFILQYGLNHRNAARHKWYYFPGLTRQVRTNTYYLEGWMWIITLQEG